MNQRIIAPGLTGIVGATLAVALGSWHRRPLRSPLAAVERERVRQASGAKKILFQNETYLKQITTRAPSKAGLRL